MRVQQVEDQFGRKKLVKLWEPEGFPFEPEAMEQIANVAKMPFIHKHVAVMPDAHHGKGATVGTVIATKGAIIPAAVGVDLGCGMAWYRTSLKQEQLPDSLSALRAMIEAAVPHGRGTDQEIRSGRDPGSWTNVPASHHDRWLALMARYDVIIAKHPQIEPRRHPSTHMGTLGTGNHFIELVIDEDGYVGLMLHSGSRGIGNAIGSYFIEKAHEEMLRWHIADHLPAVTDRRNGKRKPDADLSYLVEHTELYDDYIEAVQWAQEFAQENRRAMAHAVLNVMHAVLPPFMITGQAVECHHNYVTMEQHFGANVWVTRKGAVQAREGTLGIIPGSMGTGSFIVRGLGNKDSFCSCSHGAGRTMSRTKAKKLITMEQHAEAMQGIEARLDADVLDESPAAYKPIGAVMAAQDDLVEVVHRLHQVLNVKG
jgi:tRNA-splicing ligase RtcB